MRVEDLEALHLILRRQRDRVRGHSRGKCFLEGILSSALPVEAVTQGRQVVVSVGAEIRNQTESPLRITLVQSIARGEKVTQPP